MNERAILEIMRAYFTDDQLAGAPDSFGEKFPRSIMKDSLEVVSFIVHVEEETGFHFDITEVGPAMLDKNFNQLAAELAARLAGKQA